MTQLSYVLFTSNNGFSEGFIVKIWDFYYGGKKLNEIIFFKALNYSTLL